ncbi:hypothetical protein DL762_006412 [Monosporascus cannonballus]|uniref:Kinesin light chain n=1 Tax=Monosporascus cannonballus TaxID=155416 RepID=A0ABY0H6F4_9PEZI|nr:hypothetical protein DL762_006412 [Monosporascus cannonballus]
MAEAAGLAASVIAIIDLSAKVANLCFQLDDRGTSLQGVQHLLDGPNNQELAMSRKLVDSLNGCNSELAQLQSRLDPGKARKAMRRFGLRALKWPFESKEVAIHFAHYIHDISPQTNVFWVHASSRPRFEEAYRLVCDWLQTEEAGSWVMILDNVDDVNLFYPGSNIGGNKAACYPAHGNPAIRSEQRPLAAFLPKRRNGTLLVTSCSMDAAEKLTGSHKAVCRISTMDDAQGLQLLRNKLKEEFDKDSAADLLRALDYIPLAITQAAAYINRRAPRISVRTYLETMQRSDKKKSSLLNRDAGDLRRDETVSNSVVTTWQVTFEQIRRERPSAANLLFFMSFFNPQGIPEFVLHNYDTDLEDSVDTDAESDDFEDDLDVLRGYSLVSVTATRNMCEYAAAERFGGKAVDTTIKVLGKENLYTLDSMASLASTYTGQGQWKEAEELEVGFMEITKRVLREEHPDTLASMHNLAVTWKNQGRTEDALALLRNCVVLRKRVLGVSHPDTASSVAMLAKWENTTNAAVKHEKLPMPF